MKRPIRNDSDRPSRVEHVRNRLHEHSPEVLEQRIGVLTVAEFLQCLLNFAFEHGSTDRDRKKFEDVVGNEPDQQVVF